MDYSGKAFSQFKCDDRQGKNLGEHRGRTSTLKALAYTSALQTCDDQHARTFDYTSQGRNDRVLFSDVYLPPNVPFALEAKNFKTKEEHQQAVFLSLCRYEEEQRLKHAGCTGHEKPIISRHDVCLLDRRLFIDEEGKPRPDGVQHARQVMADFIRENYTRHGLVVSFSIHDQDAPSGTGNGNFHCHIVSSYRALSVKGWGTKKRPYGVNGWKEWRRSKAKSLRSIQTRKLERLGVFTSAQPFNKQSFKKAASPLMQLKQEVTKHGKFNAAYARRESFNIRGIPLHEMPSRANPDLSRPTSRILPALARLGILAPSARDILGLYPLEKTKARQSAIPTTTASR